MSHFAPPSTRTCSIIRSRTLASLGDIYSSVRSVKDLGRDGFCDPHDPCCVKRDPEVFLHQSILRSQSRKQCVPKNPLHFEYTILHRVKMKNRLQIAAERQQNPELTDDEIAQISEQEAAATTEETTARAQPATISSTEYVLEQSEVLPPSPALINGEELKKALDGLTNVALVHEIALNRDFRLVKPDKKSEVHIASVSTKSSMEQQMEEEQEATVVCKQAQVTLDGMDRYWKIVDHILLTKCIKDAKNTMLDLMHTLKTMLHATMLPHNLRLKMKIDQELDLRKIAKEIDREVFEISHYMDFILDTLSALCCPIHDEEILEIRNIEVPSRQIRECIDLMESMNLDMANFIISQSRKQVIQNCVMYERNNFATYIDTVYRLGSDPLRLTRNWVKRHTIPERSFSDTMAHCFAELLNCNDNMEMPETLTLDWHKYPRIRTEITRITLIGAMVSNVYDYSHSLLLESPEDIHDFEKSQVATLKSLRLLTKLRDEINGILLIEDVGDQNKLGEAVKTCCNRVLDILDQHLAAETCEGITSEHRERVMRMMMPLHDLSNSSRVELQKRVTEWFIDVAKEDGRTRIQAPRSLHVIGTVIIEPITEMMRLYTYNRGVFDILYREIFEGKCPPPSVFPLKMKEQSDNVTIVLDANKYGESDNDSHVRLDEGVMHVVNKLRGFSGRAMVYRRSHIDPRIKPMYEADGSYIVPPEQRPDYHTKELNAIEQKHYDEYLLAHEPTLEEDFNGVYVFNVGDPDWMFGYTTEQLLKLMERENLINANKLRRIKERLQQEVLEDRVADNLPIFQKNWRKEVGTLQKEFCRLQRILVKGSTPLPDGASDEPSGKRTFPGACELKPQPKEEAPKFTKRGEPIIYSRGNGEQFGRSPSLISDLVRDPDGMDLERFETYVAEQGNEEDSRVRPIGTEGGRRSFDNSGQNYYTEPKHKPETPMQLLRRNISVEIEREKSKRLNVGGLRIQIQQSFETSRLQPTHNFRNPKRNPIEKKKNTRHYSAGPENRFDLPNMRDSLRGTTPMPLLLLRMDQHKSTPPATQSKQLRVGQHRQGSPHRNRAEYKARKRSAQFQIGDSTAHRKSAQVAALHSRDSIDSLQTMLGSLQEQDIRKSTKKSRGKSQLTLVDNLAPLTTEDEEEEKILSDDDQDGGLKSGKIRFEIPTSDHVKDPATREKIRERRPTSVRTTRFTVPIPDEDDIDPDRAMKIRARRATSVTTKKTANKTPRFGQLPAKTFRGGRKASEKIRDRRPTPMMISPMFAYLPQGSINGSKRERNFKTRMNQQQTDFPYQSRAHEPFYSQKGMTREDEMPSVLRRGGMSQKIQQRSKTPEPNEVYQELKKSNIPVKDRRNIPGVAQTGDLTTEDNSSDFGMTQSIDDDVDPANGLMRIRKRRNIGRVLTPPYSRNERSNSMTVLDFRSSMFYKRSKSTVPMNKAEKERKTQVVGRLNTSK